MSQLLSDKASRRFAPLPRSRYPISQPSIGRSSAWSTSSPPTTSTASQRPTSSNFTRPASQRAEYIDVDEDEFDADFYTPLRPSQTFMQKPAMSQQQQHSTPPPRTMTATPAEPTHEVRLTSRANDVHKVLALGEGGKVLLGRASSSRASEGSTADGLIRCPVMSKAHAQLRVRNGIVYVVDIGSLHGTQLNGLALPEGAEKAIKDGDKLSVGKLVVKGGIKCDALVLDVSIRNIASRMTAAPLTPPTPEKPIPSSNTFQATGASQSASPAYNYSDSRSDGSVHSPSHGRYGLPAEAAAGDVDMVSVVGSDGGSCRDWAYESRRLIEATEKLSKTMEGAAGSNGASDVQIVLADDDGDESDPFARTDRDFRSPLPGQSVDVENVAEFRSMLREWEGWRGDGPTRDEPATSEATLCMWEGNEEPPRERASSVCIGGDDDEPEDAEAFSDDDEARDASAVRHEPELIWRQADEEDRQDALRALRAKRAERTSSSSSAAASQPASLSPRDSPKPPDLLSLITAFRDAGDADEVDFCGRHYKLTVPKILPASDDHRSMTTISSPDGLPNDVSTRSTAGDSVATDGDAQQSDADALSSSAEEEDDDGDDEASGSEQDGSSYGSESEAESEEDDVDEEEDTADGVRDYQPFFSRSVSESPAEPLKPAVEVDNVKDDTMADVKLEVVQASFALESTVTADANMLDNAEFKARVREAIDIMASDDDDDGDQAAPSSDAGADRGLKRRRDLADEGEVEQDEGEGGYSPAADEATTEPTTFVDILPAEGPTSTPSVLVVSRAGEESPVASATSREDAGAVTMAAEPAVTESSPVPADAESTPAAAKTASFVAVAAVDPPVTLEVLSTVVAPAQLPVAKDVRRPTKRARLGTFLLGALAGSALSIGALASYGASDL